MTLDQLTAPFERRRVIEYGKDGNKVVRHWYEVQQVTGNIYKSKDVGNEYGELEFSLFIFFGDSKSDGLLFQRKMKHPSWYSVEKIGESARQYGLDTPPHMYADLDTRMNNGKFIGNAEIEFVRQFDQAAAERFAQYRLDYYARKVEQEQQERLVRQAEEDVKKSRQLAEKEAEKAKYFGWADTMTPLRFGKARAKLEGLIRVDGKVMPRRDFIVSLVKSGFEPVKSDNIVTYYHGQRSKPKTGYYFSKDRLGYHISKTEYDFAVYLMEHKEVLN